MLSIYWNRNRAEKRIFRKSFKYALLMMSILLFMGAATLAHADAIWTTKDDCGDETQDANHYELLDMVYINGSG